MVTDDLSNRNYPFSYLLKFQRQIRSPPFLPKDDRMVKTMLRRLHDLTSAHSHAASPSNHLRVTALANIHMV